MSPSSVPEPSKPPPSKQPDIGQPQSIYERISSRFDVVEKEMLIAQIPFSILKVRDTNMLVDSIDPTSFSVDERLPYWADIWTSAIELARFCLTDADLHGKRVLELGCGLGLAGIAAAKAGAHVMFSDYEEDALDFARCNANRNLPPETINSGVGFSILDWRAIDEFLPRHQKFDMIIAADVVYERRNFFPLMDVLQRLLAPTGTAIFTEPGRTIGDQFFKLLHEAEFDLSIKQCSVELDGKTTGVRRAEIRSGKKA